MDATSPTPPQVWVTAPGRLRQLLKKLLSDGTPQWCYLGSNVSKSERVAAELQRATRVFIGEELGEIANELKQSFIDWVGEMGRRQKNKVNWWASRLASKSPLQTDFFLLVCYSRLADAWISKRPDGPVRILVVEDPWLRWLLKRRFAKNSHVGFHGQCLAGCIGRSAYGLARIPLAMSYLLLSSLWTLARSRLSFGREPEVFRDSREPATLIFTWIEQANFSVAGKFQDTRTGRLEEILLKQGESVWRLTPLEISGRLLKRLRSFSSSFVVTPCHIRMRDVVVSLFSWFRIRDLRVSVLFKGWNYSALLYRELLFEWGSISFPGYYLWYRTMLRMAAHLGPKVKCLIYPFENQPWEKLLCLAWREKAKHVQLIGYQHSRVPPLLLPYALSKGEVGMVPLPDRIVTNGEATREVLRAAGFPDSKLANGGALRYEYIHTANGYGSDPLATSQVKLRREQKIVLVAFPLSRPHCKSFLVDLLAEFREPLFLNNGNGAPVQLLLKCHPWLPLKKFYRGKVMLPPWLRFTAEPMEKELARADLLLYVPSTTSWREAYVAGVPVLKYEVDLLDIDAPESFNGFTVYPCRREILRGVIQKLLENPPPVKRPSQEALGKIFGRVDEKLWVSIVDQYCPSL